MLTRHPLGGMAFFPAGRLVLCSTVFGVSIVDKALTLVGYFGRTKCFLSCFPRMLLGLVRPHVPRRCCSVLRNSHSARDLIRLLTFVG